MPVLASQALATDPIPRFFQARPARKPRLTDPKCFFRRDPDFADAPETAQDGGFRHHFATQRVILRIFDRQPAGLDLKPRLRTSIGCETWLRSRVASRPKGTFLALKRALMGNSA